MSDHHKHATWRKVLYVQKPRIAATLPAPCVECKRPVTPEHQWQVGHIVSVALAKRMGWTREQINAPSNLGPVHSGRGMRCNQRAGGRLGAQITNAKKTKTEDRRLLPW